MKAFPVSKTHLADRGGSSALLPSGSAAFMSNDDASLTPPPPKGLDAHEDARALVRLIQCPICSRPFRVPITLPCGHSVCRVCLPEPHLRENISYPATPDRQQGVQCPVGSCDQEHPLGECNIDVCLSKILSSIHDVVRRYQPPEETPTRIEEIWAESRISSKLFTLEKPTSKVFNGGRLLGTYKFAELGELSYHSDCSYESQSSNNDDYRNLDEALLSAIKENTAKELDCHVCYDLMFDPVTTPCGHTFCRKCLARVLDHATHCPECRRTLPIPPSLERQASNVRLVSLLLGLCPELVQLRAEAVAAEERGAVGELDTPIFICTLAFPSLPTYLHIFEPRYRLMIRRALEGNRRFGMVMYNRHREPQGDLGNVQFLEYGTMLEILTVNMLPDGRSLIETRGTTRFRVRAHGVLDGYVVGRVERVEDVSLAEEERLEAEETAAATQPADSPMEGEANQSDPTDVSRLSTQQLLVSGLDFINRMRANSAPWLHQRIIDAYGGPPDDPAQFPYWFASILPISDEEKYQLIKTTSVRERLKIVVRWIQRIERQRW